MRVFLLAVAFLLCAPSLGFANCRPLQSGRTTEFRCPDGSVKRIFVDANFLVVRSYSPESKRWSEDRYPYSGDGTLRGVNVSVMFSNQTQSN